MVQLLLICDKYTSTKCAGETLTKLDFLPKHAHLNLYKLETHKRTFTNSEDPDVVTRLSSGSTRDKTICNKLRYILNFWKL